MTLFNTRENKVAENGNRDLRHEMSDIFKKIAILLTIILSL